MKTVFTTGEAAKICKVSQQTIIRCFDSGQLKGYRIPGSKDRPRVIDSNSPTSIPRSSIATWKYFGPNSTSRHSSVTLAPTPLA